MSQEPEDLSKWVQELVNRSSRQQIQALQRLSSLLQRVTSGELDQVAVREEYTRFIREESSSFVDDLTRLGLSFQTALLELNRKYSDRFFDQVLGSASRSAGLGGVGEPGVGEPTTGNGHPAQRREISVALAGACGEDLAKSFVIENKRAEEETVTFLVSEFTDEQSGEAFRPPLQIQPPRLTLRPGEERVVTIQLPLLPELFKPERVYRATILARGHIDISLALRVEVHSPEVRIAVDPPAEDFVIHEQAVPQRPAPKRPSPARPIQPQDDLTRIKGIGPTTAARLYAAGVTTFTALATSELGRLAEILGEAGLQRALREDWLGQAYQYAESSAFQGGSS